MKSNCFNMKFVKALVFIAGCLCSYSSFAQNGSDPVLMTINGKNITRSEFEYSYNKNNSDGVIDKKTLEEYVPLFVAFKLKVAAAEDAKYDTLTSIKTELANYKKQIVMPTIVDSAYIELVAKNTYEKTAERYKGMDLLNARHILIRMRQDATQNEQTVAKNKIDSIYNVLKGGEDFAKMAKSYSEDPGSASNGGMLPEFAKGQMIPDFENMAYSLKAGEMSQPFKSSAGWHIILLENRHPFESYEFHHDPIIKFLEQRGIKEASAKHYIDSISKLQNKSQDEVIEDLYKDVIAKDSDLKNLSQEFYDGTLMYEIVKNKIWDPAEKDEAGKIKYFAKNKKNYNWEEPRFRGLIIFSKEKALIDSAKKIAKKEKELSGMAEAIVKALNTDSLKNVRVEYGVYAKGENDNVDALAFGLKKDLKKKFDYSEVDVFGTLVKAPKSYQDVIGDLNLDYQAECEENWVEELKKKYSYKVNQDVLKTVNNH